MPGAGGAYGGSCGPGPGRFCGFRRDCEPQPRAGKVAELRTRSESHSQMEGFQTWDRHNPLPHIALSITALKSAYENTAFLSTRTSAELRELLIPGGRE